MSEPPAQWKPTAERPPEPGRMWSEADILNFMQRQAVPRLDPKNFQPGQPLWCVLPDQVREGPRFKQIEDPAKRPCVALLHHPTKLNLEGSSGPYIETQGKIDYFWIDENDVLVRVPYEGGGQGAYPVVPEYLFIKHKELPQKE